MRELSIIAVLSIVSVTAVLADVGTSGAIVLGLVTLPAVVVISTRDLLVTWLNR